jgi:hypothetical protein
MILPTSVPPAVVLDAGRAGDLTWMALERIPGQRLDPAWPRRPASPRREAVISLGAVLGALHRWTPPRGARDDRAAFRRGAPDPLLDFE